MRVCSPHCRLDPETASVSETHERGLLVHLAWLGTVERDFRWPRAAGRVDETSEGVRGEGKRGVRRA